MKKIVLAVLSAFCVSVVPVTAHQINNIDLELNKEFLKDITTIVSEQVNQEPDLENILKELEQQHSIILSDIENKKNENKQDEKLYKNYERLHHTYYRLLTLTKTQFPEDIDKYYIGQNIYIVLDDLAKALANLPKSDNNYYNDMIENSVYYFEHTQKIVNIAQLYDTAESYLSHGNNNLGYGNTAIENSPLIEGSLLNVSVSQYMKQMKESESFWGLIKKVVKTSETKKK